ncbi:MAG: hypothetical protein MSH10_03155 [Pygmaiobacter massiliensis]|nr:hypothetical protein [Pygmaiobacter massiliensis]
MDTLHLAQPLPERLDRKELLYYLGYRGQPIDAQTADRLDRCEEKVLKAAQPRWTLRRFQLDELGQPTGSGLVLQGKDIFRHLAGCFELVVMVATLGSQVETLLMRTGLCDMADSLVMDAAASCAIEAVCNRLEEKLRSRVQEEGMYLTGRFSPGYGDLPLTLQADILRITNAARTIGLTLTSTNLLVPRKSVTALLGVSRSPVATRPDPCAACRLRENCQHRKEGKYCGR